MEEIKYYQNNYEQLTELKKEEIALQLDLDFVKNTPIHGQEKNNIFRLQLRDKLLETDSNGYIRTKIDANRKRYREEHNIMKNREEQNSMKTRKRIQAAKNRVATIITTAKTIIKRPIITLGLLIIVYNIIFNTMLYINFKRTRRGA